MTREEAYKWNEYSHDENFATVREMEESIYYLLKNIYDSFEIQINEIKGEFSNRSCENCNYNKKQGSFTVFCDKKVYPDGSIMGWHSFTKDFSCNYWESK